MKPIMLTQEAKDNALEIFKKLLESATDNTDLKISITTETLLQAQGIEKPIVFILAEAYVKMTALINSSNDELAWYGIATRVNNNYFIEDILVYPQTVTAATVDADEEKCAKWFMELPDDVINNLKFQGHSHVTMSTSPSGRDTDNWLKFANLLKPNEFMILCIGNKRNEFYWNIYDKEKNVFFENKDITMCVVDDKGNSISNWAKESIEKHIIKETPRVSSTIGFYNNTVKINGQTYPIDTKPNTKESKKESIPSINNSAYAEMLSYIPATLRDVIEYEIESDTYFAYTTNLPNFCYNALYGCYTCDGVTFRTENPKQPKRSAGRPKKDKKNK